jgi:hypothetical protein
MLSRLRFARQEKGSGLAGAFEIELVAISSLARTD